MRRNTALWLSYVPFVRSFATPCLARISYASQYGVVVELRTICTLLHHALSCSHLCILRWTIGIQLEVKKLSFLWEVEGNALA